MGNASLLHLCSVALLFFSAASAAEPSAPAQTIIDGIENPCADAAQIILNIERAAAEGSSCSLLLPLLPAGQDQASELLHTVSLWLAANAEAIHNASPLPELTLPLGWRATIVGEDTYLFPPAMQPRQEVTLRIPAHQIDTVIPLILGQPELSIELCRVEEPGDDEPQAFMQFTIPREAWLHAPAGLPVIKLINAQ